MPAFAWLIKGKNGEAVMSKPLPHTCFAQLPGFAKRTTHYDGLGPFDLAPNKYIFYVSCHGSYEDAVLWAEKVNESVLQKYPFTLTAHKYDTEGSPFSDKAFEGVSCPITYSPSQKVNYWALEWEIGTKWDLVYAVTKLLFKNITYGKRGANGDHHAAMIRTLKEGGNIFEAMVMSCQYLGNGYAYPLKYINKEQAKEVYKFTQEGPDFCDKDWKIGGLGSGDSFHIMNDHRAIQTPSGRGTILAKIPGGVGLVDTPLSKLRADLLESAGVTHGSV